MCSGYYSYKGGYTPEFAGRDRFEGQIVHPQEWPEDLDYAGKRVVVIGSGATAMTLVPAMAATAAHVTMLQRSPTYVVARPDVDTIANGLRKVLPDKVAYEITRKKNTRSQQVMYKRTRKHPDKAKDFLVERVAEALGPDYDVATHFTPTYAPWDQRLVPRPERRPVRGDQGRLGLGGHRPHRHLQRDRHRLQSGEHLDADIIVTATGLDW